MAVEEDKAQSKQAKDKSVFLRFGDDGAVNPDAQAVILRMIRPTFQNPVARPVAVVTARSGDVEIASRFSHRPGPNPVHIRLAGAMSSQPVLLTSFSNILAMVRLPRPVKVRVGTLVAVLGMVMSSLVLVVPSLMVWPSRVRRDSKSKGALVVEAVNSGVKA